MKKLLALGLILILALSVFAGCASDNSGGDSGNAGDADNGNQGEKTTLIMGTNATFPPYEFYENDKIVGIDAEIAEAIANKMGLTLQIEDMDFNSIITAIQQGKVDMGMAGMTIDEDRLKNVDFTDSYATGVQVIIVKEDSDIKGPDDLQGKRIGVQETTTGDIYATEDYGEEAMTRYNKGADAVLALSQGKVDAVIIDNEPAKSFVSATQGLKILDTEYIEEEYAIAVDKGNTELLDQLNKALAELKDDGTIQSIIDKYIQAD